MNSDQDKRGSGVDPIPSVDKERPAATDHLEDLVGGIMDGLTQENDDKTGNKEHNND
ncbi:hypothetical protein J2Z69_000299 [Paenibacillus shirakamiensis]|uniref:Uncharacterized protein n=1 Tax=Paenibacillus shirakamiensis TaxID=1265935 RepID=A0ABS4JC31_9BACL|nr:hypothetical protein [Paenibacillus shirakamiensis]MBP1999280.1 hypothetical protein [Paenibacillus shirakamiensis]